MKAFPYNPQFNSQHNGMDLRDYFATTYNAGKAYINNTMNPLWISKDKWIKKSGFSDQDALIEMRIKLWFPIALEMAEESTRRWINDNKSKGNATATTITDEDKALKIVENRNKKLSQFNPQPVPFLKKGKC